MSGSAIRYSRVFVVAASILVSSVLFFGLLAHGHSRAAVGGAANSPSIEAGDDVVFAGQVLLIDVLQHSPALNPYVLRWMDGSDALVAVISASLQVDPDGSKRDIPFTVPAGDTGIHYVETRVAAGRVARSGNIQVVPPVFTHAPLALVDFSPGYQCPTVSANTYDQGTAYQVEFDDPVRPAYDHADKNIELRSYVSNTDPDLQRELVDYGSDDPTQPPQLATLFNPPRVPSFSTFYRVHNWVWAPSPEPGHRGDPIALPPVTALGMQTTSGEVLRVPRSGYDIGGGMEALVLYADEDTVALRYTRDDSSGFAGYTVHIDNLCTDPSLLALYNVLDAPDGKRYIYVPPEQRPYTYNLPNMPAGFPIGTARDTELVVAIVDTGIFQDTRSCNEWWQIRPGYTGNCPKHNR